MSMQETVALIQRTISEHDAEVQRRLDNMYLGPLGIEEKVELTANGVALLFWCMGRLMAELAPRVETKAPLHLPPDGTRDGDGTWRDGKWYPDVPDNHVQRANDPDAEEHLTVVSDEGLCRETTVREFLGWLSGHLPELHKVEVPRLAAAWEEYKGVVEAAVRDGAYL